jgi:hexosaminidase
VSADGEVFTALTNATVSASETEGVKKVVLATPGAKGRYLKVRVITQGLIPEGKPGAGTGAWLFVDEVAVE